MEFGEKPEDVRAELRTEIAAGAFPVGSRVFSWPPARSKGLDSKFFGRCCEASIKSFLSKLKLNSNETKRSFRPPKVDSRHGRKLQENIVRTEWRRNRPTCAPMSANQSRSVVEPETLTAAGSAQNRWKAYRRA